MSTGFKGEMWEASYYVAHGASGTGASALDPAAIATNASLLTIPAGVVITDAAFVVTTAITGSTAIDVGDATDDDGYVDALDITLGSAGANGGTGAYVNAAAEKLNAADTALALAVTGASTAGAGYVKLRGYKG
jgi:hypothetical protein